MKRTYLIPVLLLFTFTACWESKRSEERRLKKVEQECAEKTHIGGLYIQFLGYPYPEIKTLEIVHRGARDTTHQVTVPEMITDSLRMTRAVEFVHQIGLTDTLIIKLPTGETHTLCNFEYSLRHHNTMFSKDWGCAFYGMEIDGVLETGGVATFVKEDTTEIRSKVAEYPGGMGKYSQYVAKHFNLPQQAIENDIHGTAKVEFIVDEAGRVTDIKPLSNLGHGIEEELIRVVESDETQWKPANDEHGNPVAASIKLPLTVRSNQ